MLGQNYRLAPTIAVICLLSHAASAQPASDTPRTGPISGYMELHLNVPLDRADGDPVLDFHRFVLLFSHSFSDRLRFVGELELEHAFVEGLESLFAKRRAFGWFGGITLVLSSRLLYLNLEHFVNDLLRTDRRRNYVLRRFFFVVWLAGSMLVLLTPLLLGAVRKALSLFDLALPTALASRSSWH